MEAKQLWPLPRVLQLTPSAVPFLSTRLEALEIWSFEELFSTFSWWRMTMITFKIFIPSSMQAYVFRAAWSYASRRLRKGEFKPKLRHKGALISFWHSCHVQVISCEVTGFVAPWYCGKAHLHREEKQEVRIKFIPVFEPWRRDLNSIGKPVWRADYQVTRPTKTCDAELRTSLSFKIQNEPMTHLEWAWLLDIINWKVGSKSLNQMGDVRESSYLPVKMAIGQKNPSGFGKDLESCPNVSSHVAF